MQSVKFVVLAFGLMSLGEPSIANAEPLASREGILFSEHEGPNAPISGGIVMGVMRSGSPAQRRPSLIVELPKDWSDLELCARVTSANKRYEGLFQYPAESGDAAATALPDGAPVALTYPSDGAKALELASGEYGPIAVAVTVGDCRSHGTRYAAAIWNASEAPAGSNLIIAVNSLKSEMVRLYIGDDPNVAPIDCLPIEGEARPIAYDLHCTIALSNLQYGWNKAELEMTDDGVFLDPVVFELFRADPNVSP